jgi:twitching motility protein PilT
MDIAVFQKLLLSAIQKSASDIHLQVGYPPLFRINGELVEIKYHPLEMDETESVVTEILSHTYQRPKPLEISELDVSYGLEGVGRFRVNIYRQRGAFSIVFRVIPIEIKTMDELALPKVLEQVCMLRRGLVLVTGSTGQGKSTTLASMVEYINNTRRDHILTIEDPIEFLFKHKMSVISQREIGCDTPSFSTALQAALREDPDVIFIGEMRNKETVEIALKAAETGHLVLSTLHTPDSLRTINRLVGMYPPEQEATVRARIAESLMAVISQRLLPRKGVHGRIPAVEVLRVTRTIQECIRDGSKTADIPAHIEKGGDLYGMKVFDQDLTRLVKENLVDLEVAKTAASNPAELERRVMMEG